MVRASRAKYHLITESGVLWIIPFTLAANTSTNVDPVFVCFAIFCHIDPFAARSMARVIVCFQRSKDSCAQPGNCLWWHYIICPWRHMMATISFPASRGGGKYFEIQLCSPETAVWEILDGGTVIGPDGNAPIQQSYCVYMFVHSFGSAFHETSQEVVCYLNTDSESAFGFNTNIVEAKRQYVRTEQDFTKTLRSTGTQTRILRGRL